MSLLAEWLEVAATVSQRSGFEASLNSLQLPWDGSTPTPGRAVIKVRGPGISPGC